MRILDAASLYSSSFSCPVMKVKLELKSRWVTGIPAYAGAAMAAVTPGTTSNGHARRVQRFAFFTTAPEDKGIAAL